MASHKKLSPIIKLKDGVKKYKRGYTTGVYDLFHIGHLNILRSAKSLCDYLVVGVTVDDLVQYKGKTPVIPYEERSEIVNALGFTDLVIPQEDMDKIKVIKELGIDVLFVGSDWQGTEKWNKFEKELKEINVDVVYFPYTENASTTQITKIISEINK